ncbi:TPA: hypothetical protein ACQ39K_004834 [Yersinia enterocolitica]
MNADTPVYVMTKCHYFRTGLPALVDTVASRLVFVQAVEDIVIDYPALLTVVLVLDVSSSDALKDFKRAVTYLMGINCKKRIGVIVSRLNAYLTYYIARKLHGKVTFFDAHNTGSGLFQHRFQAWVREMTVYPMRTVNYYRDQRYGLTLKQWLTLIVPLSGETIAEMALCLQVSGHSLYQVRQHALLKMGCASYRAFCERYIQGDIRIENPGGGRSRSRRGPKFP